MFVHVKVRQTKGELKKMCTCMFKCLRLDFQIPAPLYEALALEKSFTFPQQCTALRDGCVQTAFRGTDSQSDTHLSSRLVLSHGDGR